MIGTDAFQETPIVEVTRQITKHNYLVMDVKDIPRVIKEVFSSHALWLCDSKERIKKPCFHIMCMAALLSTRAKSVAAKLSAREICAAHAPCT